MNTAAQDTLILQPGPECGEDTYIWELSNQNGQFGTTEINNYGSSSSFLAHEWTWNGDPGRRKSLIKFNFSSIPQGATILEARLDLFAYPNSPDNGHSSASGSNECVLQRVTSNWLENTVTWNTQPSVTTVNEVILPQSANAAQDYLGIDVTALCQDMINDPQGRFGFMLSMIQPSFYRAMIFASSDHPNPAQHPRITIVFDAGSLPPIVSTDNIADTVICENESILYNVFENCASYVWSDGSTNAQLLVSQPGDYWVEVTTSNGTTVDSFTVTMIDCGNNPVTPVTPTVLELPNTFTPDGDNINDVFTPLVSSGVASVKTTIFNRWGQVVYQTYNPQIDWGGKNQNNDDVTEGVYFWSVEFTALNGETMKKHGFVHLHR